MCVIRACLRVNRCSPACVGTVRDMAPSAIVAVVAGGHQVDVRVFQVMRGCCVPGICYTETVCLSDRCQAVVVT